MTGYFLTIQCVFRDLDRQKQKGPQNATPNNKHGNMEYLENVSLDRRVSLSLFLNLDVVLL